MKTAIVLLAPGFEEVEAITPIDFLRRAGITVRTLALAESREITGSHQITVLADHVLTANENLADVIVVPGGGPGSRNLAASALVGSLLQKHAAAGKLLAAICAAPVLVLEPLGLLTGKQFTCFTDMENLGPSGIFSSERVVVDGALITSRGAGTAAEFSVAIVRAMLGDAAADDLHQSTIQK